MFLSDQVSKCTLQLALPGRINLDSKQYKRFLQYNIFIAFGVKIWTDGQKIEYDRENLIIQREQIIAIGNRWGAETLLLCVEYMRN